MVLCLLEYGYLLSVFLFLKLIVVVVWILEEQYYIFWMIRHVNIFLALMLCAVGYILRMPRSPMIWVYTLFVQEKDPCLGIVLNTKETLSDFLKLVCGRVAWELVPYTLITSLVWVVTSSKVEVCKPIYITLETSLPNRCETCNIPDPFRLYVHVQRIRSQHYTNHSRAL